MQKSFRIPGVSVPKYINGQWVVIVTRTNGTEYRVRCENRQSAFDYLSEFLEHHKQKMR